MCVHLASGLVNRTAAWRTQRAFSAQCAALARRRIAPLILHSRCVHPRFCASAKQEEQKAPETSSQDEASAEPAAEPEAPVEPVVLFKAPHIVEQHKDAVRLVNISAFGSSIGLGSALLGVAPFTAPNAFMVALLLAAFQVRLAQQMTMRVLRAQVRRHVEEIIQLDSDRFSIRSGNGTLRTLHLSSAAAVGERPPLCEVLKHGGPYVFIDRDLGTIEAPAALEAMLQCELAIRSEDLDLDTFDDESEDEARKFVQSLAKISTSELADISKKQGAVGTTAPRAALAQAAVQAQMVSGVIFVVGTVIGYSGWRQAEIPPPGAVTLGPARE